MIPRDIDRNFEAMRRSRERTARIFVALVILASLAASMAAVWLLGHPRQIGEFFGLIAAGFGVVA